MPYFTLAYFIGVLSELFLSRLLGKAQKSTLSRYGAKASLLRGRRLLAVLQEVYCYYFMII